MKKFILYFVTGISAGLLNGILGAGGGTVLVILMERALKVSPHKAHATAVSIILPLTMVSSFFYLRQSFFNVRATTVIAITGTIGGFLGARLLKKIPVRSVRIAFSISMVLAGIRMLWV